MLSRFYWETVLATAITAFFYTDSLREAGLFTIAYVFISFVVVTVLEQFFEKE